MNYHARYKFKKEAVKAVRRCVRNGLWIAKNNGEIDVAMDLLRNLARELSEIYRIRTPTVIYNESEGDHIDYLNDCISIDSISVVSFLHEYRHHYQYMKRKYIRSEEDARCYSLGLFRVSLPDAFREAWRNGRLEFMPVYIEDKKR